MARVLIEGRTRPFSGPVASLAFDFGDPAGLDPASVRYSSHPRGNQSCRTCRHILANGERGTRCSTVDGPISSSGWCAVRTAAH